MSTTADSEGHETAASLAVLQLMSEIVLSSAAAGAKEGAAYYTSSDPLDLYAQVSANRFLLEVIYANAFVGNPELFATQVAQMQRLTRTCARMDGPIKPEEADIVMELKVRIATHLQRFGDAVLARIALIQPPSSA